MLRRTVEILCSGQTREKVVEWRDRNLSVRGILWQALTAGIVANIKEYQRSRNHSDFGLMPTLWTFFYLMNVQRRGHPVADDTKLSHPLLRLLPRSEHPRLDLDRPEQYGWHGRRLLLLDYAHPNLEELLGRHQSKPVS